MSESTVTATASRDIAAAPDRVFDAWLDPELVREWMQLALCDFGLEGDLRRVEIDGRPGGGFHFSDIRGGAEANHWGSYLEIERPRTLRFTWFTSEEEELGNRSVVTLGLEPTAGGTRATIDHQMSAEWAEYVEQTSKGWNQMFWAINQVLSRR